MSYTNELKNIEKFAKEYWEKNKVNESKVDYSKEKEIILDFFPYPSGVGLHVGHPVGYIATDIYARFKRLNGKNVLYSMGFDSFGLPAEQFAIENKIHPEIVTNQNISNMKKQLDLLGLSHDKTRSFNTTDIEYYKWTQWIFNKLYNSYFDEEVQKACDIKILEEKLIKQNFSEDKIYEELNKYRLAYLAEVEVNWCPNLGTVLADEEIINGLSERGNHPVFKKMLKQWVLRITKYSKRLIENLEFLDWPESVKIMQKNWIGISKGHEITFKLENNIDLNVFTTCLETLSGVTFIAISKEHPLIDKIIDLKNISTFEKDFAIFTNKYATNLLNGKKIPVFVADYVMPSRSFAVMGVPAHDLRDYKFAKNNNLEIIAVLDPTDDFLNENKITKEEFLNNFPIPFEGKNNLLSGTSIENEIANLEKHEFVKKKEYTKLRDWIFSRQRYWGEPFPIVFDDQNRHYSLINLPVVLPYLAQITPKNNSDEIYKPLDDANDWKNIKFIKLDNSNAMQVETNLEEFEYENKKYKVYKGIRETNTMPNWAGSCWYYLRYMDNKNSDFLFGKEAGDYWQKTDKVGLVDLYLGGAEHAVMHLLYARFWHMVLYDLEIVATKEPFNKLFNQGMLTGQIFQNETGHYFAYNDIKEENGLYFSISTNEELKMSYGKIGKRYKNGITPEEVCLEYGVDTFRLFMMYLGPLEQGKLWNYSAIKGMFRLLERVFDLKYFDSKDINEVLFEFDNMQKKVKSDIENLKFNTAISAIIIFLNKEYKLSKELYRNFLIILSSFAPHLCDFLFLSHFNQSVFEQKWPELYNVSFEKTETNLVITINGKKKIELILDSYDEEKANEIVKNYCLENEIEFKKIIFLKRDHHCVANVVV